VNKPTIVPELRDIVLGALGLPYMSESCKDGVKTGNHYQSVTLGGRTTEGFRSQRTELFDAIAFHGKEVLDLGSNLGELSRAARNRGARLVDGYEFDPFFIEVACAINAANRTTRVSFFERDITDPSAYEDQFDIVLAFSVWHYVGPIVDVLAQITRELLVVETHRLEENLEAHYLEPVRAYFPAYRILGASEWSIGGTEHDRRAVIAFAKSEDALRSGLVAPLETARAPVSHDLTHSG
jgi:2-polyprenyl-3-methyl-5-hydroxy-6-metoxy-1,4-benzoquinol methylase